MLFNLPGKREEHSIVSKIIFLKNPKCWNKWIQHTTLYSLTYTVQKNHGLEKKCSKIEVPGANWTCSLQRKSPKQENAQILEV